VRRRRRADEPSTSGRVALYALASLLALAVPFCLVGCGGESGDEAVPSDLVGTYETTITEGDKGSAEDWRELGLEWRLRIAATGGPYDGPALTLENVDSNFGTLESSALSVDGDHLTIVREPCESSSSFDTEFFDNEYAWALDESTLTLTPVANQCANEVALTLLTSHPWTKTSNETTPLPPP
jgi:hypothetical protein